MVAEIKKLRKSGVSWKRLDELGLEPRWIARYLQDEVTKEQMLYHLENAIWRYSKRQMTWFKKNKKIQWFTSNHPYHTEWVYHPVATFRRNERSQAQPQT